MKAKIDELEEAKLQAQIHTPTEEMIRRYLQKDADIKNKSPEEQKRIIQAYVKKVIVYENTIDIDTIVTFAGGGGGIRTPVRENGHNRLYERRLCIAFAITSATTSLRYNYLDKSRLNPPRIGFKPARLCDLLAQVTGPTRVGG